MVAFRDFSLSFGSFRNSILHQWSKFRTNRSINNRIIDIQKKFSNLVKQMKNSHEWFFSWHLLLTLSTTFFVSWSLLCFFCFLLLTVETHVYSEVEKSLGSRNLSCCFHSLRTRRKKRSETAPFKECNRAQVQNTIFIGEKTGSILCYFMANSLSHLQKIVLFKKNLELLLEWAADELVNQFAKKLETRNFRWHAFWKSQQEIPRNQSAAMVANPIIIAERVKVYKLWHRLSSCLFGISVTY